MNSTIVHSHLTLNGASSRSVNYLQRWRQHVFCHKLCFSPFRNVSWVAGVYLNDICDVKDVLLLLAVKQNLQKLFLVGLLSSFPPVTGHCLAKEACPEMQPTQLVAKLGLLQDKNNPQIRR